VELSSEPAHEAQGQKCQQGDEHRERHGEDDVLDLQPPPLRLQRRVQPLRCCRGVQREVVRADRTGVLGGQLDDRRLAHQQRHRSIAGLGPHHVRTGKLEDVGQGLAGIPGARLGGAHGPGHPQLEDLPLPDAEDSGHRTRRRVLRGRAQRSPATQEHQHQRENGGFHGPRERFRATGPGQVPSSAVEPLPGTSPDA